MRRLSWFFRADERCVGTQADAFAGIEFQKFAFAPVRIKQSLEPAEVAGQLLEFPAAFLRDLLCGGLPFISLRRGRVNERQPFVVLGEVLDRKSTRLNSSHL